GYDNSRVNLVGAQFILPIPVLNTHTGDIEQRRAERDRAALELRQNEVAVQQDVAAALQRRQQARAWGAGYQKSILPNLKTALEQMLALFERGGVDFLRVIDVRRKLLRARDTYLDALYELTQAQADLAAAVGDPAIASIP